MNTISDILEPYAEFESAVRDVMVQLFSDTCAICTACCCRTDICEEVGESAFLSQLLKQQELSEDDMNDRYGWLDVDGCTLEFGRPPICYKYFCDELLARLPDEVARKVTCILGGLVEHIGYKALGNLHLTEIVNPADLNKVDTDRITQRLEQAQAALEAIEQYIQSGHLNAAERALLDSIEFDPQD